MHTIIKAKDKYWVVFIASYNHTPVKIKEFDRSEFDQAKDLVNILNGGTRKREDKA